MKVDFIQDTIDEIIDQYMFADDSLRPWIIGFSGGKDSTVMLELVWLAIKQIKEHHGLQVFGVCMENKCKMLTNYTKKKLPNKAVIQSILQNL